jgi:hypothetical protein
MSERPTVSQAQWLRELAGGKACGAAVGYTLERFAAGKVVTSHDIYYVTRERADADSLFARLRAAGVDIDPMVTFNSRSRPPEPVALRAVRDGLRDAARAYVTTLDACAERVATADREYAAALGWMPGTPRA